MRLAAAVALVVATGAAHAEPAETGVRYISIGADALGTVSALTGADGDPNGLDILAADDDVAVLAVRADRLDEVGHAIHERHDRCGGFMLHESREDALGALAMQRDRKKPIDYTLDRAAAVRAVLPTLDKQRILGTIRELSAMPSRYYKSAAGAAASHWLATRWRSFTDRRDVTIELFDHGYPQQSVIMTIPGTTRVHEVVVIGGHLDSLSLSGLASDAPGADDDASGIATLTEVAHALLAADYRPARTIRFIAYAAEEVGLRGSQGIVRDATKRGVNVIGALQLDMTNYQGSNKDIWLMKDFTSAPQNQFLIRLIETYVGATWGLDACGYACSDHASWYRAGVPASMPFESRMSQRNMSIHSAKDTLETSGNNADHAVKFARLAAAYAIELGKGEVAAACATQAPARSNASSTLAVLALLAGALWWLSRRVAR